MKRNTSKRILSLLMSAAMVFGIFAIAIPVAATGSAYVYSFNQLKDNLEDPDITDVYVYAQDSDIPWRGITSGEYEFAITVAGTKNLHLQERAVFRVTDIPTDDYVKYSSLIHVPSGASLTVDGEGYLDFDAYWENCVNAVIYNEGNLVIHNADLTGVSTKAKASACAIWHKSGSLVIHDGDFYGVNSDPDIDHWGAVRLLAPATIRGGYFRSANGVEGAYGLMIPGNTTGITITGGIFRGIYLPTETTPFADYVPSEYTTLKDGSWFNPQSQYSQEYVRSAMVKVVKWITEAGIRIQAPVEGVPLDYAPVATDEGYLVGAPTWYCNDRPLYREDEPVARAGATYRVEIPTKIKTTDSYEFASSGNLTATINGQTATVSEHPFYGLEKGNQMSLDFGTCKSCVGEVHLSVTAPEELETVRFTAGVTNTALCSVLSNVKWYENGSEIFSGATFKEGKSYSVALQIKAGSGCEFPLDEQGDPNVYCRVNGYDAEVYPIAGKDPAQFVEVRFDFGQCNDSIIEQIVITGITPPVPGEHPSYNAAVQGSGYYVDVSKNSYLDVYWKDPAEKWYFLKNGVAWWDVTDGGYEYVYENDVFLPGHAYQCEVYVHTEDGYAFVMDQYTEPETWPDVLVNGNRGELTFASMSNLQYQQEVAYTFPVEPVNISNVRITGLDTPVAGQEPDYTAEADNPYLYQLDTESGFNGCGIWWTDEDDRYVLPGYHTFEAGHTYHMQLRVAAKKLDSGELAGVFVDGVIPIVEGFHVDRVRVWEDVIIIDAYYTCPLVTEGGTITGNINVPDTSEPVNIQLIEQGTSEPAYEAFGRESFSFTDIPGGRYTMVVSKKNHVTRSYEIEVAEGKINVDVKLHLIGDVTGDGRVNVGDVSKLYAHIRNTAPISDEYQLLCGNVNGGSINVGDVSAVYAHIKGTKKLY